MNMNTELYPQVFNSALEDSNVEKNDDSAFVRSREQSKKKINSNKA